MDDQAIKQRRAERYLRNVREHNMAQERRDIRRARKAARLAERVAVRRAAIVEVTA